MVAICVHNLEQETKVNKTNIPGNNLDPSTTSAGWLNIARNKMNKIHNRNNNYLN